MYMFRTVDQVSKSEWVLVYDFASDEERIRHMQEASLSRPDVGLSAVPLVGGKEWWDEIATGRRPTRRVEGTIAQVSWAGMGDWPEFRVRVGDGSQSTWTREGDVRRYVEGLGVRLIYVEHASKWGAAIAGLGEASKIVLQIAIEQSSLRSSGIAPGPGGAGYELARRHGDVAHYLRFTTAEAAQQAARELEVQGLSVRTYGGRSSGGWVVEAWHRNVSAAGRWRRDLELLGERYGGSYDGGEIVGGDAWGSLPID
jgi:hypothetical protein